MLNEVNIMFSDGKLVHGSKNFSDESITIDVYQLVTDMEFELQYGKLKFSQTYRDNDAISTTDLLQFVYDKTKKEPWFSNELDFLVFEGDCKPFVKEYTLPNVWKD